MALQKKLHIKTYGCQMNVYDSERMVDALAPLGYGLVDTPNDADLVLLNTCHIREKAAEKVYSELGLIKRMQAAKAKKGERMVVGVAGCVAQAEGKEIMRRAPHVELVVGPQTYHRLPRLLEELDDGAKRAIDIDYPSESKFDDLPVSAQTNGTAAFVTIQEGCDKFCTFCVVPYTRGAEMSRPVASILDECKSLAAQGVREITLLGQNVNAYHGLGPNDVEWGLGRILSELSLIPGIERLRFTTSHPRDMDDELIEAISSVPEVMPYLHLPVQAGSDKILKAMNRHHTAESYLATIDRLKRARPGLAVSGDFIVGFPGETDEDFAQTLALVTKVGYASAYSFKYSPRPGTPAAEKGTPVPPEVMDARLQSLQQLLSEQSLAFNQGSVGKTMSVLFDKPGRKPGQLIGKSPYLQSVVVEAPKRLIGEIASVHINEAGPNSLKGNVVIEEER
ncbi:MAG: tRNA (N6-isopentenyl adenosine(37)-C2)-methylthiotransferase MiaB [Alphaproteobacteria bacterium]